MTRRIALSIIIASALAYVLLLSAIATGHATEPGAVGCATVEVHTDDYYHHTRIQLDDDVSTAVVGHYLWVQYAEVRSSDHNVVSYDLTDHDDGDVITVCTDWIPAGETIPTGPDTAVQINVTTPPPAEAQTVAVVVSSVEPHPSIAQAWITDNGYVIR